MAQVIWTPYESPITATQDTTTFLYPPQVYDQTWTININFEFPEKDDYGDCGGYIP